MQSSLSNPALCSKPAEFRPARAMGSKVFPNPAKDYIIYTTAKTGGILTVYDVNGRFVKSVVVTKEAEYVSVKELSSGVYTLKYVLDESIVNMRFVVE